MSLGAASNVFSQSPNNNESACGPKLNLKGKTLFEAKCATCHGLDGRGGEHAPDIVRRHDVKAFSDEAWFKLLHDGIPEAGMPGFPDIDREDAQAVIAYLRVLQGGSAANSVSGDPARGRDLFSGKARCSGCHKISRRGQFAMGDLAGFARDHAADEIRDAILRPAERPRETATAVAQDGRKFSGTIRNEDNASLQLQDGDGQFYLLMKPNLVSVRRQIGDPMPADYRQRLSSTEIDDLVAYILREARSPSPSSLPFAEGHAQD